ncbi:MAG: phosphoenolpyruvate mutase [Pseudomonadota bacterium]|nr:phosphoenolpyruvate mutase [Pseudomonadota bacterium]
MATNIDVRRDDPAPALSPKLSKAAQLRAQLKSPELSFLMEAHDGLSSKIVEEAGFRGVWASGLSMATALGVRDSNEASWTQVLEILEFMSDATSIPILMDGDTGFGNFNNMRRLVRKLCQRDIAGVCIEDKLFPKTNSFLGHGQPLADIDEFCGKIKAGKDSQTNDDFCVVARIEALISGWGLDEALRRAEAYHDAGADALLVHSKISSASEILAFMQEWDNRSPVVIVPTTYYGTPTDQFRDAGISAIIWANHSLRASIKAMRETVRAIHDQESIAEIEDRIASLRDVFTLAGNAELSEAEDRYLPSTDDNIRAVVLAASRGSALGPLTEDQPKCMVDIRGQPLLRRLVSTLRESGVRDVNVVRGYRKEAVDLPNITTLDNDDYETTGEAASLACALDKIEGDCVIAYGDILFRRYILDNLLQAEGDIVVGVDAMWRERAGQTAERVRDLVQASATFSPSYHDDEPVLLRRVADDISDDDVCGEWIGLARLSARGSELLRAEIEAMREDGSLNSASLPDLFSRLALKETPPRVVYVTGHWLDVNDAFDLAKAGDFT